MNERIGISIALCLILFSTQNTAYSQPGRSTSAACAWSGTWTSSDGSFTQTIQLRGQFLNGTYTLRDEECPQQITGSTRLSLNPDGVTASGSYHENDNRCWGASSGAIAYALDANGKRIDFLIRTEEGEEYGDYMLRKGRSPECDPQKPVAKATNPQFVDRNKTAQAAQPKTFKGNNSAAKANRYVSYQIMDQDRGMAAAVINMPADWRPQSNVMWNYQDTSLPVRLVARAESQKGDVWVEAFPTEMFYWLEPEIQPMNNGVRDLGMIKQTPISAEDALYYYAVHPARGNYPNFRVVSSRKIKNLAQIMGDKPVPGQSVAIRVAYQLNGQSIEEEFYGMLTDTQSVPSHGPSGTVIEHHNWLQYVHSMGAAGNKLDSMKNLLGGIASSFTVNPSWQQAVTQVIQYLRQEFNAQLARDYAGIQAAGQLSRQISAQNDAWLANFEQQRLASDRQMDQFMADMHSTSEAYDKSNDNFSDYMRGTEKMQDPYWGESDQSYDYQYHWTDGLGSYKHSNNLGDDPNIGSTQNWTLMQPAP